MYNESGNINQELFGKHVLPFWFNNKTDHKNIFVTCDGATAHSYKKAMPYALEAL